MNFFAARLVLLIFLIFSFGLPMASVFAQQKAQADSKIIARIKFTETAYNFGVVPEGTIVSHVFNFKNTGNSDLQVQRVVSGCGCTAASSSMDPVAPGASGSIKVDFNTQGFSGAKEKSVRVYSNSYDNPEINLTISGTIERDVNLEPARILFDDIVHGYEIAPKEFSVKILPESGKKIQGVSTYSKFLKVEKIDSHKGENSALISRYKVSVDKSVPVGELRDRILVAISKGSNTTSLSLPVIGRVTGSLTLEPAQVSFGIVEGKNKLFRSIKLKNMGNNPVEIISLSSDTTSVVPTLKVIEAGKSFMINVELDAALVSNDLRALIEIKTSNPEEPLLYLSVFGVVPPKSDF